MRVPFWTRHVSILKSCYGLLIVIVQFRIRSVLRWLWTRPSIFFFRWSLIYTEYSQVLPSQIMSPEDALVNKSMVILFQVPLLHRNIRNPLLRQGATFWIDILPSYPPSYNHASVAQPMCHVSCSSDIVMFFFTELSCPPCSVVFGVTTPQSLSKFNT